MKRFIPLLAWALIGLIDVRYATAADVKISALPAAAALSGTEPVPTVQAGATVATTPSAISAYVGTNRGANPTGTVGLTGVNGTAITFLRSDGAPPLDVGISPTWTGLHTFSATEPIITMDQTGGGTNRRFWQFDVSTGRVWTLRTADNALATFQNAIAVTRGTTTTVSDISFGNATNNTTFTFLGTGAFNSSGTMTVNNDVTGSTFSPTGTTPPNAGLYAPATGTTIALSASGVNIASFSQAAVTLGNATNNPTFTWLGTGLTTLGGGLTVNSNAVLQSGTAPIHTFNQSGAGTDLKRWIITAASGVFSIATQTDAGGAGVNIMTATRGATTAISAMTMGNATNNPTFGWLGTGTFSIAASLSVGSRVDAQRINLNNNATLPTNGFYAPGTNQVTTVTNGVARALMDANGLYTLNSGVVSGGTKFTTSGCSVSATTGGAAAGVFTLGANTCSVVITLAGATGATAPNGWTCQAHDRTAPLIVIGGESSSTATTATVTIPATAGATDVISFSCTGY